MADTSSDILQQLQEHEITPPASAFNKAWDKVLLDINDPNNETVKKNPFERLQEYHIPAPSVNLKTIMAGGEKKQVQKPVVSLSKNLMRVAAVIAIAIAGTVIYMMQPQKKEGVIAGTSSIKKKDTTQQEITRQKTVTGNDAQIATTAPLPAANTADSKNSAVNYTSKKTGLTENAIKKVSTNTLTAKSGKKSSKLNYGKPGSIYNNDMFFTLVNYQEYGKEKFFNKAIKDKKVTLTQFSYVNLSDKMVEMLQEVYTTKKNGKPSRKAKKAKKKFEKWRKSDENYFDENLKKNPTDIVDLSEFLMKN
jgi:hypothetical protein